MKHNTFSFLFFYAMQLLMGACLPSICVSQSTTKIPKDSTNYYYKAILNPKTPEILSAGMNYYIHKKNNHLSNNDTLAAINDLRLLAIGEFKIGNNYDSENYIVEALELIESLKYKDTLIDAKVGLFNQLGRIYKASNNPSAAIEAFDEALKIVTKPKDSIIILNNKANIYKSTEQYELALIEYTTLLDKAILADKDSQLALVLDNMGYVQSKTRKPEALKNLQKALVIRVKGNYQDGLYSSYRNLSEYYLDRDDKATALSYAQKALEIANRINSSTFKLDALALFLQLDTNPYIEEYTRLTDSIADAKQIAENKNAYLKYNVAQERKKTEASKLLQEIESKKRLRYQFLSVLIFLALIASYFIFRYRKKQANLEAVYTTETRIAKKIHDEVANDIYKVMAALDKNPETHGSLLDEMEKIYIKTRDISRENRSLDVTDDFESLLTDLFFGYKNQEVQLVTRNLAKINWKPISEVKKRTIYRILQELLTNMKKHSKATSVALLFAKHGSKIQINYSDNGVGCDLKHKNGLQNTETRIASINGTISFESKENNGFKATIIV